MAKVWIAATIVVLLAYAGWRGRAHAMLEVRLNQVTALRAQLLAKLDESQRFTPQLVPILRQTPPPALSTQELASLASALRMQLDRFDSDYTLQELPRAENLEIRLSQAALANAEQHFSDVPTTITAADENGVASALPSQKGALICVLRVRGDSFYGLHKWEDALVRYERVLKLQSNRLMPMARIADCDYAMGRLSEVANACDDLAKQHDLRGNLLLVQGKPDAAQAHYEAAIEIQDWLGGQPGKSEIAAHLARSHYCLGGALLLQEKPEAAVGHFGKAAEIQTRLVDQGQEQLAPELATSHFNFGNSLVGLQQLEPALRHYDRAIEILSQLRAREEPGEDLARSYNNRGVVLRALGNLAGAISNFDASISILSAFVEGARRAEVDSRPGDSAIMGGTSVRVEVAIEYNEKGLEVSTRARFPEQGRPRSLGVALGVSLKNLGYAHLLQGKLNEAMQDFQRAMNIYAKLFEQEGNMDLALEFANSLSPVAWIYATNPDTSRRNAPKAKEYALKACELSEWKVFAPVEALAAACAQTGDFNSAAKWQQKAIDLAPPADKPRLLSALQLYTSGRNPYLK